MDDQATKGLMRCCFCGSAISNGWETTITDSDRLKFDTSAAYAHTECLKRYKAGQNLTKGNSHGTKRAVRAP